jgi:class 3 adenylate cyclase/putative methionine-R-sulfoxide reductase with GAF domain/DNA-binding FrmR family transcriptional regulator
MKRRSTAGGGLTKGRRRKAAKPIRRNAPKAVARSNSSHSEKETEVTRLARELRQRTTDLAEALEQQTATADILRVISSSPSEIQPVLEAIVQTAAELCAAEYSILFRLRDGKYHVACSNKAGTEFVKFSEEHPIDVDRGSLVGRTALERRWVHIEDCLADPEYGLHEAARIGKHRTMLGVPLLHDGVAIGVIGLLRTSVKPFTDKQIELVTTFASQADIAIENARLLNELRQRTTDLTERTADLTEALEQQTATSEVLQVISSSPGDLEPVFAAMLENAARICDANFGNIFRWDGDALHLIATHNTPPSFAEYRKRQALPLKPNLPFARMVAAKAVVHCADAAALPAYVEQHDPEVAAAVELGGIRTFVAVPMLKENNLIGALIVYRQEVRPFTNKQIELVKNFAAQAVIAIENARLLNELRQRTSDLTEALEQQTATSEVLQVISSSPGDLEPVFATMLEKAARLCDATFGNIYLWDGEFFNFVAAHNTPPAFLEVRRRLRLRFGPKDPVGRMLTNKNVVHIADLAEEQDYIERSNPGMVAAVELAGVRTHVVVPMLKDDELIGTFHLSRQEVRPFNDKQIELVTNFAAQAVIAIENTRLLKELRERTEEVEKLNQHLEHRVADQVGEIERMSRLRRFLPPQVADLIVASGSEKQLESHRREITALFCDLRGFTGFTESADAEDVMALLRDYHAAIGEIIIKYNGTLERYAGDGVMVVFNDPVPVENPALQAVLMALELRDAIGKLTDKWRRFGHDIGFGIGIAHGFATLGTIGFEGRFDYAAIGTVSNVASRLCDEAKPGQILISPRVLAAVENAVKVEPVGEFELKGIRRPLAAYNVVATVSE